MFSAWCRCLLTTAIILGTSRPRMFFFFFSFPFAARNKTLAFDIASTLLLTMMRLACRISRYWYSRRLSDRVWSCPTSLHPRDYTHKMFRCAKNAEEQENPNPRSPNFSSKKRLRNPAAREIDVNSLRFSRCGIVKDQGSSEGDKSCKKRITWKSPTVTSAHAINRLFRPPFAVIHHIPP